MTEAWITGYGLVSPLGSDVGEAWRAFDVGASAGAVIDPISQYPVLPVLAFNPEPHVPDRSDRRQMGDLMLYATVAASKALEMAGLNSRVEADEARPRARERREESTQERNVAARESLELLVAAGSGERDVRADEQVIEAYLAGAGQAGVNEALMRARPSHFLTQLPNLLPSNICIVQGLSAPSRTFMGGAVAGLEAVRTAVERIRAGQGKIFLVGSAKNARCMSTLLSGAAERRLATAPLDSVWTNSEETFCLGGAGAFVVIESEHSARARGAEGLGCIKSIASTVSPRDGTSSADALAELWERSAVRLEAGAPGVLSGAPGPRSLAASERSFLQRALGAREQLSVRAPATLLGHAFEASFLVNLILAVECLKRRTLWSAHDPAELLEPAAPSPALDQLLITCWGLHAGEGFAQVEARPRAGEHRVEAT